MFPYAPTCHVQRVTEADRYRGKLILPYNSLLRGVDTFLSMCGWLLLNGRIGDFRRMKGQGGTNRVIWFGARLDGFNWDLGKWL